MVSPLVWRVDSTFRLPVWETVKPILSVISSGGAAVGASLVGCSGGSAGGTVGVAAGVHAPRAIAANNSPTRAVMRMFFIVRFSSLGRVKDRGLPTSIGRDYVSHLLPLGKRKDVLRGTSG